MIDDSEALRSSLERLSTLAPEELDLHGLLQAVLGAVCVLFRVAGAGVMLVDDHDVLRSVAATDERGSAIEQAELLVGTGPCIDGFAHDRPVPCADLAADPRYQEVYRHLAGHRLRAVLGVPIRLGGGPIGVLDVCLEEPHDWNAAEIDALVGYADVLGGLLGAGVAAHRNDALARQLQYALDHRVVIERAIGYLMGTQQLDPTEAFDQLRRAARRRRQRVAELAGDVLTRGSLD